MSEHELKPCPFCGEKVFLYGFEDYKDIDRKSTPYYYVKCGNCGATVWGDEDKEKAVEAWNRRTQE